MCNLVDVYVDESGDLGFSARSSRHIVVIALATAQPLVIRRLIRRAQGRFGPRERRLGELKFNSASRRLRSHVLEGIALEQTWISWSAAFKPRLPERLRIDREALLNWLCRSAIRGVAARVRTKKIDVIVDRRQVKEKVRRDFDNMVRDACLAHHVGHIPPDVHISHFDSQTSEGLQAADFVAGAVYRSLERGDGSFLAIIKNNVVSGEFV